MIDRGFWWRVVGIALFTWAGFLGAPDIFVVDILTGSPAERRSAQVWLWAAMAGLVVGLVCFLIGMVKRAAALKKQD